MRLRCEVKWVSGLMFAEVHRKSYSAGIRRSRAGLPLWVASCGTTGAQIATLSRENAQIQPGKVAHPVRLCTSQSLWRAGWSTTTLTLEVCCHLKKLARSVVCRLVYQEVHPVCILLWGLSGVRFILSLISTLTCSHGRHFWFQPSPRSLLVLGSPSVESSHRPDSLLQKWFFSFAPRPKQPHSFHL